MNYQDWQCETSIVELETGEEVKINKDNLYYTFYEIETAFKGQIIIKITNEKNALIEFVFKYNENNAEILTNNEYGSYNLTKKLTIIKFDKNVKNKDVSLSIFTKNEKEFKLSMIYG